MDEYYKILIGGLLVCAIAILWPVWCLLFQAIRQYDRWFWFVLGIVIALISAAGFYGTPDYVWHHLQW
jgi:uncharacterized membrane protein YhaH (DUF805 family)